MPTIFRIGPYRLFFVSLDYSEPPHVHVQRENMAAKFWLEPLVLERAGGFRPHELNTIAKIVQEKRALLVEKWNEHFNR